MSSTNPTTNSPKPTNEQNPAKNPNSLKDNIKNNSKGIFGGLRGNKNTPPPPPPPLGNNNNGPNKNKPKFNLTWVYFGVLALLFIFVMSNSGTSAGGALMSYTKFQALMDSGYVENITVDKSEQELTFYIKQDAYDKLGKQELTSDGRYITNFPSVDAFDNYINLKKSEGKFTGFVKYENGGNGLWNIFWQIFPFAILIAFWILVMRRMGGGGSSGGIFSFGKSKAKLFEGGGDNANKITFKDVAGLSGAKQEVQEVVDFLRNPQKYTELGGKIPKGILLVGPPGTGKTLLAKAVAGEANVSFFSMSGSDFVEMFVGVGASRVRDLFEQAKHKSPSIVFIDEIDAIGRARSGKASIQSNDERESTLNQLLTEMDGFGANTGVIVMAATNRADILDKALLRAGRFDRQINVELPDLKERQQIFNVHLKPIKIDESVDVEMLSRQTPGLSGADIANVCNEAALIAARRKQEWVDKQCFLDAIDRVLGGLEKKTKVMTDSEKRTIAIHEAGHATISWFLQYSNPLVKVTIVPRGNALGANWYMPEERPVTTKEELLDQICGLLGGRAAEELFTGHICTGASNDLERVTKMVYGMISIYGMGKRMPNVNYYNFSDNSFSRPYSESTAQGIDEEVKELIEQEYNRAKKVLIQNSGGLQRLAQRLIDREVIYPADLEEIFGPRPWRSRSDEIFELNQKAGSTSSVDSDYGQTDFNDENAEIIRQKAINAVLEKQKKLMQQDDPEDDQPQAEVVEPMVEETVEPVVEETVEPVVEETVEDSTLDDPWAEFTRDPDKRENAEHSENSEISEKPESMTVDEIDGIDEIEEPSATTEKAISQGDLFSGDLFGSMEEDVGLEIDMNDLDNDVDIEKSEEPVEPEGPVELEVPSPEEKAVESQNEGNAETDPVLEDEGETITLVPGRKSLKKGRDYFEVVDDESE